MKFSVVLVAVGLVVGVGCSDSQSEAAPTRSDAEVLQSEPVATEVETTTTEAPPTTEEPSNRAEDLLAALTPEEKVGQLFMPVVAGSDPATVTSEERQLNLTAAGFETPAEIVAAYKLGGIIYLGENIVSADQVGTLSDGLQQAALDDTGIGLLVAVDQEGGRVNRLTDGVTVFPPAALLSGDTDAVREAGYLTGRQVAGQGINVVLAPVADLTEPGATGAIGNRSYGDDPDVVAEMVVAAVDGLQDSGVAAAVKHWPGHGATTVDSHVRLPVLDITRDAWEDRERVPFEAAIDSDVAIVLVGHLALPAIDPGGSPATVSPVLIDDELRRVLGFDGVVMTDALNMGAVSALDRGEIVVQSVIAGADILLVPPDLKVAYEAMLDAVSSGEVTAERLDDAVLRVLRLKEDLGLLPS